MVKKMLCWLVNNIADVSIVLKRIIILIKSQVIWVVFITFNNNICPVLNNAAYFTKTCNSCKTVFIYPFAPYTAVPAGNWKIMIIFFIKQRQVDTADICIAAVAFTQHICIGETDGRTVF